MGLKETLKQKFSNKNEITLERYRASKFTFILFSFLFFLNFYFIGANIYSEFFTKTLGVTYIVLLLSILFYIYFYFRKSLDENTPIYIPIIILVVLILLFIFLLFPVIVDGGITGIL